MPARRYGVRCSASLLRDGKGEGEGEGARRLFSLHVYLTICSVDRTDHAIDSLQMCLRGMAGSGEDSQSIRVSCRKLLVNALHGCYLEAMTEIDPFETLHQ